MELQLYSMLSMNIIKCKYYSTACVGSRLFLFFRVKSFTQIHHFFSSWYYFYLTEKETGNKITLVSKVALGQHVRTEMIIY